MDPKNCWFLTLDDLFHVTKGLGRLPISEHRVNFPLCSLDLRSSGQKCYGTITVFLRIYPLTFDPCPSTTISNSSFIFKDWNRPERVISASCISVDPLQQVRLPSSCILPSTTIHPHTKQDGVLSTTGTKRTDPYLWISILDGWPMAWRTVESSRVCSPHSRHIQRGSNYPKLFNHSSPKVAYGKSPYFVYVHVTLWTNTIATWDERRMLRCNRRKTRSMSIHFFLVHKFVSPFSDVYGTVTLGSTLFLLPQGPQNPCFMIFYLYKDGVEFSMEAKEEEIFQTLWFAPTSIYTS